MAVAYVSTRSLTPATGTGGTSSSWDISSASEPAIIVYIAVSGSTAIASSVSWSLGSGTAAQIGAAVVSGNLSVFAWKIPAPTPGSGTYTVTLSESTPYQISADLFSGCDQTDPSPSADDDPDASDPANGAAMTFTPSNVGASDAMGAMTAHVAAGDSTGWSAGTTSYENNTTAVNMLNGYRLGNGTMTSNALSGGSGAHQAGIGVRIVASGTVSPPVDSARVATNITTAATSHAINVGSPAAGTLLIVFVRFAAAPGAVTFTGYTSIASDSSDATDDTTNVYYRWADGTEGATDTLGTGNSVKLGAIAWEVTGAEDPGVSAPQISTVAVGTTAANTADPGSVAPAGAPQPTLYIALAGGDGEVGAYTGAPTNYSNLQAANSGTGGTAATNVLMGGASRAIASSSSDNPGAFTHAAHTTGWTAYTVAIRAPVTATSTGFPFVPYWQTSSLYKR